MKLITWNVNGIRSAHRHGFLEWIRKEDPDIVCLQETKADICDLPENLLHIDGYHSYFHSSSVRKGHAGVAVYTKREPRSIETRLGIDRFDDEGRALRLEFGDFTLFNFYLPHGSRDQRDLPYKFDVYRELFPLLERAADAPTLLAGDFNIAHTELDLYYPRQNAKNVMFTPEERAQIDMLLNLGYTDTFRALHPETKTYTWWPYRDGLRERDIGWRIDYIFASHALAPFVRKAFMQRETPGSDHGPYGIVLGFPFDTGR